MTVCIMNIFVKWAFFEQNYVIMQVSGLADLKQTASEYSNAPLNEFHKHFAFAQQPLRAATKDLMNCLLYSRWMADRAANSLN